MKLAVLPLMCLLAQDKDKFQVGVGLKARQVSVGDDHALVDDTKLTVRSKKEASYPADFKTLELDAGVAAVEVRGDAEAKEVKVVYEYFELEEGDVKIEAGEAGVTFSASGAFLIVRMKLVVPDGRSLRIRTRNANLNVTDYTTEGDVKLQTSNGWLTVQKVTSSSATLKTSNAHIKVQDSTFRDVTAQTTNGNIELKGTKAQSRSCSTTNGRVIVEGGTED